MARREGAPAEECAQLGVERATPSEARQQLLPLLGQGGDERPATSSCCKSHQNGARQGKWGYIYLTDL
ncbi:hypothetical protein MRX96_032173 [Rhipicephalus microplus]